MSIYRVSTNMANDNGMNFVMKKEDSMNKVHQSISTGKKYVMPRDNPVDVTQAMTFHSKIFKIDQLERNINDLGAERNLVENKIGSTIEILQRVRELSVQGSNGIYTAEDRKAMSVEVDQLMKNIIVDANSKYKGNYLFSGFQKFTKPFEVLEGAVRGADTAMITEVRYLGDNGKQLREIDFNEYAASTPPGSDLFWAENFQIYSKVNTADFRLENDMSVMIDNQKISFNEGDNAYAIVDKINRSPAAVNASIDIVTGGMIIKSTTPHKVELADIEGGNLLQNLGILAQGRPIGPDNFSQDADVFGGSIFDTMIGLRDAMLQNNAEDIGGRFLGAIDESITNLTNNMAKTGALQNRLDYLTQRLGDDKMSYTKTLSSLEDVNMADALTELATLDFAHKASLSSLAKITKSSLMDFLR
ncbi:MAG: flagellar hook-associated protein 3 [Spirochaetes bacterium GWF1_31_7]|nr:MAG: flagellar hook-associated protein 3 [Spirochaetes bacterium GWE1_32_154]OHD52234.1 MAG: flagellar hook-associated protein 3 [Spirochaetes bacterium GWE2_31_10]OHD53034.1 MAG: flagellar hook-associated protein 3 [Spirochaetes bacterium GWF1_31_7]OHD80379.1 MAG: flagellar hook-associated protein 3 [Spirochaetes bacterium RIFOXYB1_FULL_32_8]HBD96178.1 flagellar hook-associated protein 3 [Spirochaetia bacterium]